LKDLEISFSFGISRIVFAEIAFAAEIFANKAASMGLWEAK